MSVLLPADYIVFAIGAIFAIFGLFRGFSGIVSFLLSIIASVWAAPIAWSRSIEFFNVLWQRVIAVAIAVLLVFAIVRVVFTKFIKFLLSQPADSILGLFSGLIISLVIFWAWSMFGVGIEYSYIVQQF
jgi:uncharacterized membrane protein required for colicin V production